MRQRRRAERAKNTNSGVMESRNRLVVERRRQKLLYGMGMVVAILLSTLLLAGFYFSFYRPPRIEVAVVGDKSITRSELLEQTRLLRGLTEGFDDTRQALSLIIRNEILQQRGRQELPIVVLPSEIDGILANQFENVGEDGTPPETMTAAGQTRYTAFLENIGVSDDSYRGYIEGELMMDKLGVNIALNLPETQEQLYVQWIVTGDMSNAEVALERLEGGMEFLKLAQEISLDQQYSDGDGTVGWIPWMAFPSVSQALYNSEKGTLVGPIETEFGFVIAKFTEGPEMRAISDEIREILGEKTTNSWMQVQFQDLVQELPFDQDDIDWILLQLDK